MTEKITLITGANRGLGRSMALHLAAAGHGVIGTYHAEGQEAEADTVVREVAAAGGKGVMLLLDVGRTANLVPFRSTLTETLQATFGRSDFDFLVNNAGIGNMADFVDTTEEEFDQMVQVDFKGPFFLSQTLLPLIAKGGAILNVSTALTRFVFDKHCAYASIKSGVEVMTRYMAKELGPRGITVNVNAPGAIETDFAGGEVHELSQTFGDLTPLGRVGMPDDIGSAVAGLLSGNFGWLNGQRIEMTGGQSL